MKLRLFLLPPFLLGLALGRAHSDSLPRPTPTVRPSPAVKMPRLPDMSPAAETPAPRGEAAGLHATPVPVPEKGFFEIAGGVDLPASNWQPAYLWGGGGRISEGLEFPDGVALGLEIQFFSFSGKNFTGPIADDELLFLPTLHFFLEPDPQGVRPYLSLGAGMETEFSSAPSGATLVGNPDLAFGAGLLFPLSARTSLFVEAKYNFVFTPTVIGQDLPVLAGGRFGL